MIYVPDTDILTIGELPESAVSPRLQARFLELAPDDRLATTIVTYEEQTRGWLAYMAKSRTVEHQVKAYARLYRHLHAYARLEVIDFDVDAARTYESLLADKPRVGTSDLKIAAIVVSHDAVLLSRNLRDFRKVSALRVEDWTQE